MTQLWSYRGKAQKGIPAIDCRFHYINHFDIYNDLVALYNSRICNQTAGSEDIAGSIIAIWNDRYITDERQNLKENNFYPCMLALAERAWCGGGHCYFDGKGTMLWDDTPESNHQFADFERRLLWHKNILLLRNPSPMSNRPIFHGTSPMHSPTMAIYRPLFPRNTKIQIPISTMGKNTKPVSSMGQESICATHGAHWYPHSIITRKKTTLLMLPPGSILLKNKQQA